MGIWRGEFDGACEADTGGCETGAAETWPSEGVGAVDSAGCEIGAAEMWPSNGIGAADSGGCEIGATEMWPSDGIGAGLGEANGDSAAAVKLCGTQMAFAADANRMREKREKRRGL